MNFKVVAIWVIFSITVSNLSSQVCTTLGQNPQTAFPVCGTNVFTQSSVPVCGNVAVPSPVCKDDLTDKNPYWYKFTCFQSGTLGFLITPNNLGDDYDWQLYDITGKDPSDVYSDSKIIIASNWSGDSGLTGATTAGRELNICAGYGQPVYSSMPSLIQGHNYLLLISHFTNSQSGYKLSFGGGTGSITDTKQPHLQNVVEQCLGTKLIITLNKKLRCNSLAPDGSDFLFSSPLATIQKASAVSCASGFDMDTLVLTLSNPVPPGNYKLTSRIGTDGNTIADICGTNINVGEEISFSVAPVIPTPMDSLEQVRCAPQELKLIFKTPLRCNSIAANGTDFVINGPSPVVISGASGTCDADGFSRIVLVKLQTPIYNAGNYTIRLVNGSDLNTILDECGLPVPAGSSLPFSLKDTVSAIFTYNINYGCKTDTIAFFHDGRNSVDSWKWSMSDNKYSTFQNPEAHYSRFGEKRIILAVSNGFCADTANQTINLDNAIDAKFIYPDIVCPEESASFKDSSTGNINSWNWNFGNGFSSNSREPGPQPYTVPPLTREQKYNVRLIVGNELGCFDTATITLKAVSSCYIAVPSAFTPNRDGVNDYLYPLNAFKATDLSFKIFNRFGQIVFETTDWTKKWDGTIKGKLQASGTYVWTLSYTETDTGKKVSVKGSSTLIR